MSGGVCSLHGAYGGPGEPPRSWAGGCPGCASGFVALRVGPPISSNTVSAAPSSPPVPVVFTAEERGLFASAESVRRRRAEARIDEEIALGRQLYTLEVATADTAEDALEAGRKFYAAADAYRARRLVELLDGSASARAEDKAVEGAEVVPLRRTEKVGVDG